MLLINAAVAVSLPLPLLPFRCRCCCRFAGAAAVAIVVVGSIDLFSFLFLFVHSQACGISHSQLVVGLIDLFSLLLVGSIVVFFFCEGVFFQFLGCPCTNLVGNLPERKNPCNVAKYILLEYGKNFYDILRRRRCVLLLGHLCVQTGRKSTRKKNPCY